MQHVSDSNILGHDPSWHGEACHRAPHCHNAIFSTLPHYLIAILPHPPTCYVRAVWKYGYGHFYALARALIPAFPPSYNAQKYFTMKNPPTIFNSTSSFLQKKNICRGNPHPGSRWLERNSFPNHTYLGSLVSR